MIFTHALFPRLNKQTFHNSSMIDQITADMKDAMRSKDKVALNTIRALKTAIKNAEIDSPNSELSEPEIIAIIRKQIKQRNDSITQFIEAKRPELADNEKAEVAVLEKYLPQAMSEEEVKGLVADVIKETGASSRADMGNVMKLLQQKTQGRVDGKLLSQTVMAALS